MLLFIEEKKETWTCETGILPGHQADAITKLMTYSCGPLIEHDFRNDHARATTVLQNRF